MSDFHIISTGLFFLKNMTDIIKTKIKIKITQLKVVLSSCFLLNCE